MTDTAIKCGCEAGGECLNAAELRRAMRRSYDEHGAFSDAYLEALGLYQAHQEEAAPKCIDLRELEYGSGSENWHRIITAMGGQVPALVHESIAEYFLGVLPPRMMFGGGFAFAEGDEDPVVFLAGQGDGPFIMQRCRRIPGTRTSELVHQLAAKLAGLYFEVV
jgi:hypothetical protein